MYKRLSAEILSFIIICTISIPASAETIQYPEIHCKHYIHGIPVGTPSTNDLIIRDIYAMSCNDKAKFADWVAYRLDKSVIAGDARTARRWEADPLLADNETLEPEDYKGMNKALKTNLGYQAPSESFKGTKYRYQTNYLLNISATLYRARAPFTDGSDTYGTGTFILPASQTDADDMATELANNYGLEVYTIDTIPGNVTLMQNQKIAVFADYDVRFFLKEYGFDFDYRTPYQIDSIDDLAAYDLILDSGWSTTWSYFDSDGENAVTDFFEAGGGFVGIGRSGADFSDEAGIFDVDAVDASQDDNGIIMVDFDPDDPITAQFPAEFYAFVYGPVWFTSVSGLNVSATIETGGFFVSGYWNNWQTSGAAGDPVVVHGVKDWGTYESNFTLIGINPTFRGHPEFSFWIVANAIYSCLE